MPRRRSGKKIDFTHWTGVQQVVLALGAGTIASNVSVALHESETWLRFRGNILFFLNANQIPGAFVQVAVGFLKVPEGTGTTVLASPATNPDSPWLWYDIFGLAYEEAVTDVVDMPGTTSYRASIDSKAMRIIRNEEIQMVTEVVTLGSATSVNGIVSGRVLTGQ